MDNFFDFQLHARPLCSEVLQHAPKSTSSPDLGTFMKFHNRKSPCLLRCFMEAKKVLHCEFVANEDFRSGEFVGILSNTS